MRRVISREFKKRSAARKTEQTPAIYALHAPGSDVVRYVGFSRRPTARLESHRKRELQKSSRSREMQGWIEELYRAGQLPQMRILEWVSIENWEQRERDWIAHFRSLPTGVLLLNKSSGGLRMSKSERQLRRNRRRAAQRLARREHNKLTRLAIGGPDAFGGPKHFPLARLSFGTFPDD